MRYTEIDLQINDIIWFGIDMNGFIFACTTAGTASVPEFVCMSKEQTELLADYFMEKLEATTAEILETPYIDNSLINDAIMLAKKSLFAFDAASGDLAHDDDYVRIASPQIPLQFTKSPDEMQNYFETTLFLLMSRKKSIFASNTHMVEENKKTAPHY